MERNDDNFDGIPDIFDDISFLAYEEDPKFLEWYSIEGLEKINELSRQLQSFFNFKTNLFYSFYLNPCFFYVCKV